MRPVTAIYHYLLRRYRDLEIAATFLLWASFLVSSSPRTGIFGERTCHFRPYALTDTPQKGLDNRWGILYNASVLNT